jgi:toxin-antitoxin system PIN domain toxin
VIVVDLNLLIYAINEDTLQHARARRWWETVVSQDEPVGLPWLVILGFLRLTTNPKVMPRPLTPAQAVAVVDHWFAQRRVVPLDPTDRHWAIFKEIITGLGTAGNITSNAHLASIAIEHGGRLFSTDADFARFAGLRWTNPLAR